MFSASIRSSLAAAANASRRTRTLTCIYQTKRSVRTRPWSRDHRLDPLERDERLLKKLEDQLVRVKEKIKQEEEEEERVAQQHQFFNEDSDPNDPVMIKKQNEYFWTKILTSNDRALLLQHDIDSMETLFEISNAAEEKMNSPPFPSLTDLGKRLQVAHEMYSNIPAKIANATRAKHHKKSWW